MQASIWPPRRGAFLCCLLLQLPVGCGGIDPLELREREVEELRYQIARMRESIGESIDAGEKLEQELLSGEEEKRRLREEAMETATNLRFANEQVNSLSVKRKELEEKLAFSEESHKRAEESLARVKSVASASAGELTDLRLRSRDLEERLGKFTETNRVLSEESTKLSGEVERLQAELVRTRVVVRSLQQVEGGASGEGSVSPEWLERLKRENADLTGEKIALEKRLDQLEGRAPVVRQAAASVPPRGEVYRENPAGLLDEIAGFLERRYEKATRGEIAWDSFDLAVVGAAGLAILVVVLSLVRLARARRLKRELFDLRLAVQELEESATRAAAPAPPQERTPAGERAGSRSARKGSPRRSGFMAVISPSGAGDQAAGESEESWAPVEESRAPESRPAPREAAEVSRSEAPRDEDPFERLLKRSRPEERVPSEKEPKATAAGRKIIGAGVWQAQKGAPAGVEVGKTKPQASSIRPAGETGQTEDEALANTQIMPSLSELDLGESSRAATGPQKKGAAPASGEDDILAELKSVINKKFEELLK